MKKKVLNHFNINKKIRMCFFFFCLLQIYKLNIIILSLYFLIQKQMMIVFVLSVFSFSYVTIPFDQKNYNKNFTFNLISFPLQLKIYNTKLIIRYDIFLFKQHQRQQQQQQQNTIITKENAILCIIFVVIIEMMIMYIFNKQSHAEIILLTFIFSI
jgi:hypothetical protein